MHFNKTSVLNVNKCVERNVIIKSARNPPTRAFQKSPHSRFAFHTAFSLTPFAAALPIKKENENSKFKQ